MGDVLHEVTGRAAFIEGVELMKALREMEGLSHVALHFRVLRWLAQTRMLAVLFQAFVNEDIGAHAIVRSEDADFVVQDAGSRNGVAVASRGDVALKKGSKILVGDKLMMIEMA